MIDKKTRKKRNANLSSGQVSTQFTITIPASVWLYVRTECKKKGVTINYFFENLVKLVAPEEVLSYEPLIEKLLQEKGDKKVVAKYLMDKFKEPRKPKEQKDQNGQETITSDDKDL